MSTQEQLETQLNSFDATERARALALLAEKAASGEISCQAPRDWVNLHCHSFYSYSGYDFSPSAIAWMGKKLGLSMLGLVDFDVLDGVEEFHNAGRLLGIKTIAGMETRAYIPSFSTREINSPGEPGITYHMASGFINGDIPAGAQDVANDLVNGAKARNLQLLGAVNPFLAPVELDYDQDVLPLTPNGNATERHICQAYENKAEEIFPDADKRAAFWTEKLGDCPDNSPKLQGLIRSKTMKRGGVGYQQPEEDTFPLMTAINDYALATKALPTITWLDGTTQGETDIGELLDLHQAAGAAILNIVPDRNWNIADEATKKTKVANLYKIVELCNERELPIIVGTELNAPGLKFVDDFDAPELAPVVDSFRRGANILFGHTVESVRTGNGYCSDWAHKQFATTAEKNAYFEKVGKETVVLPK